MEAQEWYGVICRDMNADRGFCIAEYVAKYATKEQVDEAGEGSDDSDEMSSVGSYNDDEDDDDVQPAGTMEV